MRISHSGRGAARLAHLHGVQGVGGSNPLAPTDLIKPSIDGFILYIALMDSNEEIFSPPTNKHSIISLILGLLTAISFCGGVMPIPLTGFVCFPTSFLLGLSALIYGAISLRRIKKHNESGHSMAWTGIVIGGFIFFCILSVIVAFISIFIFAPSSVQPLIDSYSI